MTILTGILKYQYQKPVVLTFNSSHASPFNIVNFPNLSGNIPQNTSYVVFICQILKYVNVCMSYRDVIVHSRNLILKLRNQFYRREVLITKFRKCNRKYQDKLQKFDISNTRIIEDLFCQFPYMVTWWPNKQMPVVIKPQTGGPSWLLRSLKDKRTIM